MEYLKSAISMFELYKTQAEKALVQVSDENLAWHANEDSNSIVTIIKHMVGNMKSRWTDFLTTDGEKPWRQRDEEFENGKISREALLALWEDGWNCVFSALHQIREEDLNKTVLIRGQEHSVIDAINRQMMHYAAHVGQIIYIAKMLNKEDWKTLTIPRKKVSV